MKLAISAPIIAVCALLGASAASGAAFNHGVTSFHATNPSYDTCVKYGRYSLQYVGYDTSICSYGSGNKFPVQGAVIHGTNNGTQSIQVYFHGSTTATLDCYLFSYDSGGTQLAQLYQSVACNSVGTLSFSVSSTQRSSWGVENLQCFMPLNCELRGYASS